MTNIDQIKSMLNASINSLEERQRIAMQIGNIDSYADLEREIQTTKATIEQLEAKPIVVVEAPIEEPIIPSE
jgi:endonuclease V-like protein UPF0215 family